MWTYGQTTGLLCHDGLHVGTGYSGHGPGLNNPAMEAVVGVGPIPQGEWHIGPAYDHPHSGPCVMDLTPVGHDAHKRTLFRMHGDNAQMNHTASDGCIIQGAAVRRAVAASPDRRLMVTA